MAAPSIAQVPMQTIAIEPNKAQETAVSQISDISAAAKSMLSSAESAITNVKRGKDVTLSDLNFQAGTSFSAPPTIGPFVAAEPNLNLPSFTGSVSVDTPTFEGKEPREFTATEPSIEIPGKPAKDISEKPVFSGEISNPELPEKPDMPSDLLGKINEILNKYNFPEIASPEVSVSAFSGSADVQIPVPSSSSFNWGEPKENTAVTLNLVESLVKSLKEHGFGLDEGTENVIYLRHKSRIEAEYDEAYTKTDGRMAAMGWNIPAGSHLAALAELEEKKNRALLDASREVMTKNAELTFEDRQKAREVSVQFEGVYRQYLAGYYQRSLEAAKTVADDLVRVYGLQMEGAKIQLQKHVTEIQLYEAEVRSAMLALEVYKGKLEGQRVQAEIRGQDIQAMLGYIQAIESTVRLYEAELKGSLAEIEVDKGRIAIFESQLKAWMSEIQAYATDVDAWGKEVQSTGLQTQNYLALAQAYSAEMEGVKAYNQVESSKAQIELSAAQIKLEGFKGEIEAYKAEAGMSIAGTEAAGKVYAAKAQAYKSAADVQMAGADLQAKIEGIKADTETKQLALALEQNKANMENALRESLVDVDALKAIGQMFSQLAASLYSAINVGASISDSYGVSVSDSNSYSASVSNSMSYSYDEKAPTE